jgi:dihydrofolate reductase
MGKIVLDMAVSSLDGFVAGPDGEPGGLHDWFFPPSGSREAADAAIIEESIEKTGAILMGRRTYDLGSEVGGFAGTPYGVEHFVLTHEPPERAAEGASFTFVTEGIGGAIERARASAGDRNVVVGGGASVARQCMEAGLLDEINLHLAPVLLGGGARLFVGSGARKTRLERTGVVESPHATHLRFRILKEG